MDNQFEALKTALLPQYQGSAAFMERFLVAAHTAGAPIVRASNSQNIKLVDGIELKADALTYFLDNKDELRAEFMDEVMQRPSVTKLEIDEFCEVVSKEWFDGKRLREHGRPRQLKRSVFDYLCKVTGSSGDQLVQTPELPAAVQPLISKEAIAAILTVNDQLIQRCVEDWLVSHPNWLNVGMNDVFLHRGLALEAELDTSTEYREWDFINSYSIAFSAPEKFSQMMEGRLPAIVNGEIGVFQGRILFFSPFIPGMETGQLEMGIIPSEKAIPIHFQGWRSGVLEYILDPPPFHLNYAQQA